jgi:IMP dehydrogenase
VAPEITPGLSYDDVLLVPQASAVLPRDVDVSTVLHERLKLKLPVLSAAMDKVTEAELAIALARQGGLGVIHKSTSIEKQASMVEDVKRSESGFISDPVTLGPDAPVGKAYELMARFKVSGFPVVDGDGALVGIVTNRDLRFGPSADERVRDHMTSEGLVTAAPGTSLEQAAGLMQQHRVEKLPIVDGRRLVGMFTFKDIEKIRQYPSSAKDARGRLLAAAAVGVSSEGEERGADIVKVGVGPGSICTTRIVTGVGMPQFTAVAECAEVAQELGVATIADGGIRYSGDVVKALAAGATAIMVGNLLAGTDESPGELVLVGGRRYKEYRGMGSIDAMRSGSADRYFQSEDGPTAGTMSGSTKLVPEGVSGLLPYRGSVAEVTQQLEGGLRSGMGYLGAKDLPSLAARARFVQQSAAGARESHVHDLDVVHEAPNYHIPGKD